MPTLFVPASIFSLSIGNAEGFAGMADTGIEDWAQTGRAQKLWSRLKRATDTGIALVKPDSRKDVWGRLGQKIYAIIVETPGPRTAKDATGRPSGDGRGTQSAKAQSQPTPEKGKLDLNKDLPPLPRDEAMPATPFNRATVEKLMAEKMMASQAEMMGKVSATFGALGKAPQEPGVDVRSLRSQDAVWGSVAPRAPKSERIDRSTNLPDKPAGLETAQAIKMADYRGAINMSVAKNGKIVTLGNKANAVNISPSPELKPLSRNASISTIGSTRSTTSMLSDVSAMSNHTVDTSMSVHNSAAAHHEQQAQPMKEAGSRPPASQLYDTRSHTSQLGR